MSRLISVIGACMAAVLCPSLAHGQTAYPNRVIKIVVPYAAGSVPDILMRGLAPGLASRLNQQLIIENRVGASGTLGTAAVARAEPDGYTLLFAPAVVLSVLPQARGADTGYQPDALVPICQTFVNTMGVTVRPDSPIKGVADLVATAKQRPGTLNYGHPGVMTIPHLAVEEFVQTTGIDIKDIPFRSGSQTVTELIAGRIDFVSLVVGTEVGQNIRLIGVFSEKRLTALPDVPTFKEQGFDVSPASFGGLLAPKSTPAPILTKLSAACADAAKDQGYATIAKRAGQPDEYYDDAEAFRQRLIRDIESKARVLARLKTPS